MEILKFSEPPKRSNRSGSAKRSGLMPMVTFGIAVLVLGGMGTTLAGTITLNGSGNSVEFGQGVVTTAACDSSISVIPVSAFDTATSGTYKGFYVNQIKVAGIGSALSDTTTSTGTGGLQTGCLGKTFKLTGYDDAGTLVQFQGSDGSGTLRNFVSFKLPSETSTAFAVTPSGITELTDQFTSTMGGDFKALTTTAVNAALTNTGLVTITGFKALASLARITLETS